MSDWKSKLSTAETVASVVSALVPVAQYIGNRVQEASAASAMYSIARNDQKFTLAAKTPLVFAKYTVETPANAASNNAGAAAAAATASGGAAPAPSAGSSCGDGRLTPAVLAAELMNRLPLSEAKKIKDLQVTQSPPDADGNVVVAFFTPVGFPVLELSLTPASINSTNPPTLLLFSCPSNWSDLMVQLKIHDCNSYKLPDDPTKLSAAHAAQMQRLVTDILSDALPERVREMVSRQAYIKSAISMEVWGGVVKLSGQTAVKEALHQYGPIVMEKLGITRDDVKKYFGSDEKQIAKCGVAMCTAAVSVGMMINNIIEIVKTVREAKAGFVKHVEQPMGMIAIRVVEIHKKHMDILVTLTTISDPVACRGKLVTQFQFQLFALKSILNQIENCKSVVIAWMQSTEAKSATLKDRAWADTVSALLGGVSLAVNLYAGGMAIMEKVGRAVSIGADAGSAIAGFVGAAKLSGLVGQAKAYVIVYDNLTSELTEYNKSVGAVNQQVKTATNNERVWPFLVERILKRLNADTARLDTCVREIQPFLDAAKK